jgi:hypothetical protein
MTLEKRVKEYIRGLEASGVRGGIYRVNRIGEVCFIVRCGIPEFEKVKAGVIERFADCATRFFASAKQGSVACVVRELKEHYSYI